MYPGWISGLGKIAAHMDICRDTLYAHMKVFEMPIVKWKGKWFADPAALNKWLNSPYEKRLKKGHVKNPTIFP